MVEVFANNASTTLAADITSPSATTLTVASALNFPSTGNFRLLVDTEIMLVTGVSGTTFTVTRGQEGTTAATHASGTAVDQVLTKGSLAAFRSDSIVRGAYSSLPAAGVAGRLYGLTDGPYLYEDDGSAWKAWGPVYPLTPPDNSLFSWVNQSGAVLTQAGPAVILSTDQNAFTLRAKAAPATPYTITVLADYGFPFASAFFGWGLAFRDSASGKFHSFQLGFATSNAYGQFTMWYEKWTNESTFSAEYGHSTMGWGAYFPPPKWLRMSDDGTNRKFSYSNDGYYWIQMDSEPHADFLTPNQVCFFVRHTSAQGVVSMTVHSWLET